MKIVVRLWKQMRLFQQIVSESFHLHIMKEVSQQKQRIFNICIFSSEEGEIEDKDSFENMCTACISITRDSNSNIYCIKHII